MGVALHVNSIIFIFIAVILILLNLRPCDATVIRSLRYISEILFKISDALRILGKVGACIDIVVNRTKLILTLDSYLDILSYLLLFSLLPP